MGEIQQRIEETEEFSFESRKEYDIYMDSEPDQIWIQERSLSKTDKTKIHLFLPLFIQYANLDYVFKDWHVIKEVPMSIENGVATTVTIFALPSYPDAQHITFTGSAAVPFKSSGNAVEFDLPSSRSRAIGNASITLGNVFGRNLNRTYKVIQDGKLETARVKRDFSLRRKKTDD